MYEEDEYTPPSMETEAIYGVPQLDIRQPKITNNLQEILLNLNAKNTTKYIFKIRKQYKMTMSTKI